ncbi:alpha/beta hydrolase [Streptomyces vulcanius]|uniref:Alpha/beta hydrolase n=1 Tax=Streptomyces vulcanius TaxID=1441876 RepID=A0ABV9AJQ8_9ACTN
MYCVLFDDDDDPPPDPAAETAWYARYIEDISAHTRAPRALRLSRVAASSWPSSLVAKAAELQGDEVADRVLRRLRETVFVLGEPAAASAAFASRLADAVAGTASDDGVVRPVVLVGADSGAAAVAALLDRAESPTAVRPDALVLAGLPGRVADAVGTWDDELDVRTSCPAHRGTLTQDPEVRRGSLGDAIPDAVLAAVHDTASGVPVLLLVGDADPLADHEALERAAKSLGRARLSVVRGAHHDVLNGLQHRSVAAEVVSFLETLRNELQPLITVRSSAW